MTKEFLTKVNKFLDERAISLKDDERLQQNILSLELLKLLWKGEFDDNKEILDFYAELRVPEFYTEILTVTDNEVLWKNKLTNINSIVEIIEFSNGTKDKTLKPNSNENFNNFTTVY